MTNLLSTFVANFLQKLKTTADTARSIDSARMTSTRLKAAHFKEVVQTDVSIGGFKREEDGEDEMVVAQLPNKEEFKEVFGVEPQQVKAVSERVRLSNVSQYRLAAYVATTNPRMRALDPQDELSH